MEIPFGSTTRRELFNLPDNEEVGPGRYDPQLVVKGASPKYDFSFSSKREYFVDYEKTPSPAEYSNQSSWIKQKAKEPSPWIHPVNQKNLAFQREKAPTGLGNTEVDRDLGDDCSNFGRALEDLDDMKVKSRSKRIKEDCKPKVRPGTRAADFGRSRAPQRDPVEYNGIPGPADYEIPKEKVVKRKSPAFFPGTKAGVFSTQRNDNETMLTHHPWCDVDPCKKAFGTGAKRDLPFYISDTPGAGQYDALHTKKAKKAVEGFGASRKEDRSQTPGPGYYNITEEQKKTYGNGKRSKRGELWEINDTPAPNQYDVESLDKIERRSKLRTGNPAFRDRSMRSELANTEVNPGPIYNTRPKTQIRGAFPKAARFTDNSFVGTKINDDPSPAEYNVPRDENIRGGAVSRNAHTDNSKTDSPGPAKYKNIRTDLAKPSYNVMFNPNLQKTKVYH